MAQRLDVAAARAQGARAALGWEAGDQPLDAALATAAATAGAGLARDLADGLRITVVDGRQNGGSLDLMAVANQRIRRLRPYLIWHVQNFSHRVKAPSSSAKKATGASYF
tara:strand:- start:284 stop:613 length:330 start_codon:yes stop_codon:yes gene_type:complete